MSEATTYGELFAIHPFGDGLVERCIASSGLGAEFFDCLDRTQI